MLVQDLLPTLADTKSLAAGSWDADIVDELTPAENDFIIDKNRYSAFYGTGLEPILTSLGVGSLACAESLPTCVSRRPPETPASDDYRVFVVSDATGELEKERHEMALSALGFGPRLGRRSQRGRQSLGR